MNIGVIGATGATGLEFVRQAVESGHRVTALVRSPQKMTVEHANLQLVQGDVYNEEDVARVVTQQDVVFIALGTGPKATKSTIREDGTRMTIQALKKAGESPFLLILSSLGVNESTKQIAFFWPWLLAPILGNAFKDHREQEKLVRASGFPHLIMRPTNFKNEPAIGAITAAAPPKRVSVTPAVTRADVVAYALQSLSKMGSLPEAVALTKAR